MIKEGYKETKIGLIPNDWEVKKLGDVCSFIGDGIHSTPKYCTNGKYYFINGNNLKNGTIVHTNDTKLISFEEFNKLKQKIAEDALLLSINGTIGNCSYYNNEKILLGKSVAYINLKNKNIKNFIYYVIQSPRTVSQFYSELTGSTIKNLSLKSLRNLCIPLPPLKEQQKIAEILTKWDNHIETLENLISKKEEYKKGLMQNLLTGKVRFPGFNEEWKEVKLGEICKFLKGNGLSKEKLNKNGKFKCILYGELYTTYSEVIKEVLSKTDFKEKIHSEKGDILIPASTTTTGIDLANATAINEENVILGGDINILRKKYENKYNNEFLAYYLTYGKKYELAKYAQGTTIVHLYGKDIKNMKIQLPTLEEQEQIAEVLSLQDKEIEILKEKLELLKMQKKGLMQKLLTGEIRVKC
ncbi:restriction endonuclease subunit S [Methanococcus voltae]|uniref:Restriction modification system DNA specificity domain protein n=1 Tax=Methanococcus voltae (strain ATCC BAA-1334 / A3) TaxID=456320 RepID=D7DS69_METV3|nr:restriction endonuclease subunit S [Methanococcus voltae]MCS3901505.1 type I restriction enzyme S subunit [Methanococcus voltae]